MVNEFGFSEEKLNECRIKHLEAKRRQKTRDELLATFYKNGASVPSLAWYFRLNESTINSRLVIMGLEADEHHTNCIEF